MPQENDDNLLEALNEHMRKEREQKQKEEYASWCEAYATLPSTGTSSSTRIFLPSRTSRPDHLGFRPHLISNAIFSLNFLFPALRRVG